MNKKGAEGGLWLKIFYFILALVIVVFTYNFLSGRIEDNLYLGYVSRESGLNVDAETQQLNFPTSVQVSYYITPKILLDLKYSFTYRTGDERNDKTRVHTLDSAFRWVI